MSNPELRNTTKIVRQSRCYACGQELASFAVLICPECLSDDCEKFETLISETKPKKQ